MEHKKQILYVPFWIAGMLERNNLPLSAILDYRKMSLFLSAQEQANVLCFQNLNPFKTKTQDGRQLPVYGSLTVQQSTDITASDCDYNVLSEAWRKCYVDSSGANDSKLSAQLEAAGGLAYSQVTEKEVEMRFDPANGPRVSHEHPFITYDVEREFLIVVVYPAFFAIGDHNSKLVDLCKAVLKVLYVYSTPSEGCKTPYFRKYLESLV